jgi:hypothetical protein
MKGGSAFDLSAKVGGRSKQKPGTTVSANGELGLAASLAVEGSSA